MTSSTSRFAVSLVAATLAVGLAACGKKDDEKVATQVAAKVGSEEISVHQINQVLSRTNTAGTTPEAAKAMSREVLEKLIDQQLAVDKATENKLHRSPEVVSQLEASRHEILARAYLQTIAGAVPKPTPEELKKYYADHPQLFSERRLYNVQEIVVPASANVTDQLRAFVSSGKTFEEVAGWLQRKDIKFGGGAVTRAAEQIPLALLARLHTLKDGQVALVQSPQQVTLLRLASSKLEPVPEVAALPRIEQFLTNQRANDAIAATIKKLRTDSEITYMGEFATATANAAPAPATAPAAAPVAQVAAEKNEGKSVIEKGVAGLK